MRGVRSKVLVTAAQVLQAAILHAALSGAQCGPPSSSFFYLRPMPAGLRSWLMLLTPLPFLRLNRLRASRNHSRRHSQGQRCIYDTRCRDYVQHDVLAIANAQAILSFPMTPISNHRRPPFFLDDLRSSSESAPVSFFFLSALSALRSSSSQSSPSVVRAVVVDCR